VGKGGYAAVNGLEMYYEVHGEGDPPLVLLHGGFTTIGVTFGGLLPALAQERRVVAVEQQGHGRTPDADRPLAFARMADDTAAVLGHLGIEGADLFGYSDGGNVALGLAIRHPGLVRRMAVAGVNYDREGLYPEALEFLENVDPDGLGRLRDAYVGVAPDPGNWPTLVRKVARLNLDFEGWRPDYLRSVDAPALVMVGDEDDVTPEHAVELFRLLPDSRLAVLPNTNHISLLGRTDWLLSMLGEFFDSPPPDEG
jgi:pimeloyl-ACP methyl ester carboxylesterase